MRLMHAPPSVLLREARPADYRQILRLARELDSTSLPTGATELAELLECSKTSFAGKVRERSRARYVFAAEEISSRRIVAVSMIIGKHGTPSSPHYYFEVADDERYSHSLKRMFRHTYLRLRYAMDGPTEIGGLIVSPELRGHPERIGKQISWVRFLYIARNRRRFESQVLAEMLPPNLPGHQNRFWDHYGRRVTGLSYKQADRLSTRDKEFIRALFPDSPIYVLMLPEEIRTAIGEVGDNTRGALRILEQAGMRYLNQIDPFDGGPYYGCRVDEVAPIRSCGTYRAVAGTPGETTRFLVSRRDPRGYRAVASIAEIRKRQIIVPAPVFDILNIRQDDQVDSTPLEGYATSTVTSQK
jgi:arginine N-succinyltransferase